MGRTPAGRSRSSRCSRSRALGVGRVLARRHAAASSARTLRERFAERAEIASALLDSLFRVAFAGQAARARERFGGATVDRAALEARVARGQRAVRGWSSTRAGACSAPRPARRAATRCSGWRAGRRHVRQALTPARLRALRRADGVRPVVETAVGVRDADRAARARQRRAAWRRPRRSSTGTLAPLPGVGSSAAYVLDGNGRLLGAAARGPRRGSPRRRT